MEETKESKESKPKPAPKKNVTKKVTALCDICSRYGAFRKGRTYEISAGTADEWIKAGCVKETLDEGADS